MTQCIMQFNTDIEFLLAHVEDDPLLLFAEKVDWGAFRERLEEIWHGDRSDDPAGRKACDVVLMFKLLAVGAMNRASYARMQKNATADHMWRRFLQLEGITLSPDKNAIWAYANVLAQSGRMPELFGDFHAQMAACGYTPQEGQLIDATWVPVPKQRNTPAENDALKKGELPPGWERAPAAQLRQKDRDATWRRKHGQWVFGFQNHVNVDRKYKLIMTYAVTTAATHDSPEFESLLRPADTCRGVWADRAYGSAPVGQLLPDRGYDNHIQRRGTGTHPLDESKRQANRRRARVRARVEHGFGATRNQLGGQGGPIHRPDPGTYVGGVEEPPRQHASVHPAGSLGSGDAVVPVCAPPVTGAHVVSHPVAAPYWGAAGGFLPSFPPRLEKCISALDSRAKSELIEVPSK